MLSAESTDKRDRAIAAGILLAFLAGVFVFLQLSIRPFFAYAVGGAFLILLATAARPAEWLAAVAIAPPLAVCYWALGNRFGTGVDAVPANALAFLGLASCFLLGRKAIRDAKSLDPFLASVTIPLCTVAAALLLDVLVQFEPRVYDFYLYRFDSSLGGQASAAVVRWLIDWPLFKWASLVCYETLPLAQSALVADFFRARRSPRHFFLSAGMAGIAGFALYQLMPVIGPRHIFGPSFLSEMHRSVPLIAVLGTGTVPRNGLPSLHFAWALLLLWNIEPSRRVARALAYLFLLGTILATLGTGEHYLIDLIVAVPFALSVQKGCLRQRKEMGLYGAIALLWIVYLRFGMPYLELSRGAAWLACGITLLLPALLRLAAAGMPVRQRMIGQQELASTRLHDVQFQRGR
jgi:hypothetical protein